ncbi:MAG: hypothetical protein FJ319_06120 [SAR202 cluster bacterium]|nr:hypothetical protein [SAR202 cluster bacterium]
MTNTTVTDLAVGQTINGKTKFVTSYRTWQFSGGWPHREGWPAKNVHTDLEFAKTAGFPTRGASGAMLEGYLAELMVDTFGEEWLSNGAFTLKFIAIVDAYDKVTTKATVLSKADGKCELEVWCDNQRGEKVAVGAATARV